MLGARIALLRRQNGMSQRALAEALHVSPSAVGMYEQERRTPSNALLLRMAKIFSVSTDFLLTGQAQAFDAPKLRALVASAAAALQTPVGALSENDAALLLNGLLCAGELTRGEKSAIMDKTGGESMTDEEYMREALKLAREAADDGEVPVGCVITDG